jgi:hypothetical protein
MTKFTENLWSELVREHGPTLEHADRPAPGQPLLLRRPRLLAAGTLGLAGMGTALLLALSVGGAPPAYAVTTNSDGSVTVQINETSALPQANAKLTAMGIHEQVTIYMAAGPAAVSGPVTCTPGPGTGSPRPPVKVIVGTDGTETISPGQVAGNTGEGTFHLARCTVAPDTGTGPGAGNTGDTGITGGAVAHRTAGGVRFGGAYGHEHQAARTDGPPAAQVRRVARARRPEAGVENR